MLGRIKQKVDDIEEISSSGSTFNHGQKTLLRNLIPYELFRELIIVAIHQ